MAFAEALIVAMTITLICLQWIAIGRARGRSNRSPRIGLSALLQSRQILLLSLSVGLGAAASWARVSNRSQLGVALTLVVSFCVVVTSYLLLPPAIVVLGRSRPDTRRMVRRFAMVVFPLRVAHLIRANPLSDPVSFLTGVRSRDASQWKRTVRALMHEAAVVAVDASDVSPAVVAEAIASLGPDSIEKVVFVVHSLDDSALLDTVLSEVQVELPHARTATPRQLERWFRGIGWKALGLGGGLAGLPMSAGLLGSTTPLVPPYPPGRDAATLPGCSSAPQQRAVGRRPRHPRRGLLRLPDQGAAVLPNGWASTLE